MDQTSTPATAARSPRTGLKARLIAAGGVAAVLAAAVVLPSAPASASSCGLDRGMSWNGSFHASFTNCSTYTTMRVKATVKFEPDWGGCYTVLPGHTVKIYDGWNLPTGYKSC